MRLLITGGGSGGHVYPALACLEAWRRRHPDAAIGWAGSPSGMERHIVEAEGLTYLGIPAEQLRGRGLLGGLHGAWSMARGLVAAVAELRRWRPSVVLATGGYVTAPVLVAARLLGVPSLILLPDVRPGLAVRFTSWLVNEVCVTTPAAREHLKGRQVVETGYPVRRRLFELRQAEAQRTFGLSGEKPVLLVAGGSQGARTINESTRRALPELLSIAQVIHVCGADREPELRDVRDALTEAQRGDYHLFPFLHDEMPAALAAADLAVSRSGASVMGEYPAVGLPSILVPYPYAGSHQRYNARQMADLGAAELIENADLTPERLTTAVRGWLERPERLRTAAESARALARPDAAERIADEIDRVAARSG